MVELLVDVLLEVGRERRGQRIGGRQSPLPPKRRLRERHRRADDLVLKDQVLGPQ